MFYFSCFRFSDNYIKDNENKLFGFCLKSLLDRDFIYSKNFVFVERVGNSSASIRRALNEVLGEIKGQLVFFTDREDFVGKVLSWDRHWPSYIEAEVGMSIKSGDRVLIKSGYYKEENKILEVVNNKILLKKRLPFEFDFTKADIYRVASKMYYIAEYDKKYGEGIYLWEENRGVSGMHDGILEFKYYKDTNNLDVKYKNALYRYKNKSS